MAATRRMMKGINSIDGLYVLGQPEMSIFSFASRNINVFSWPILWLKGGLVPAAAVSNETPHNLHITLMNYNVPRVDEFLQDLAECVEEVKASENQIDIRAVREQVENMLTAFGDNAVEQFWPWRGGLTAVIAMLTI